MNEEVQEVPKWLKELEEKRERRLKVRLGHEAGAGSPCLACEDKCPGLDLHFWRKICKNCKCGKENHDVDDDDIYGWAQFQLLGSKPSKTKKFAIPGRKDAVQLDWVPKGVADAVESYLKELPLNLLPITGSTAALERKQLLQKQIPLHDIDPTLCHALSEDEVKQMNDYIADVKQNSVGVGRILKLKEFLISNRSPMQVPQMENIILQGVNHSSLLHKNLHELKLDENHLHVREPNPLLSSDVDDQNPTLFKNVDVDYTIKPGNNPSLKNYVGNKNNQSIDYQQPRVMNIHDVNNPMLVGSNNNAKELISNQIDNQYPLNLYNKDVEYSTNPYHQFANQKVTGDSNVNAANLLIPKGDILNSIDHQYASIPAHIRDIHYAPNLTKPNPSSMMERNQCASIKPNLQSAINANTGICNPKTLSDIHQINTTEPLNSQIQNRQTTDNQTKTQIPKALPSYDSNNMSHSTEFENRPLGNLQIPQPPIKNQIDQQTTVQVPLHDLNYSPNENHRNITNIRDLAFSTYNPHPVNNPDEINATPLSINVGLIKDIEYPTIKSAVHTGSITEPTHPRKNVQFNLTPEEILPSCHKCKKMFTSDALVIGVERTDALWHADCFKCAGCNQNLADLMYFYDKNNDDIYCGRDYAKIRGIPRCQACDELIFVKEYCLAENSTFHIKHFCCFECDVPLAGQNYVMEDSQPLCLPCFELLKAEKCTACLKVIKPDEQGVNLKGTHFHVETCFICKMCKKPLLGEKFLFKNLSLYCSMPCFHTDV